MADSGKKSIVSKIIPFLVITLVILSTLGIIGYVITKYVLHTNSKLPGEGESCIKSSCNKGLVCYKEKCITTETASNLIKSVQIAQKNQITNTQRNLKNSITSFQKQQEAANKAVSEGIKNYDKTHTVRNIAAEQQAVYHKRIKNATSRGEAVHNWFHKIFR